MPATREYYANVQRTSSQKSKCKFRSKFTKKNLQLIGEQIDCREGHCAHYMRRRFEMCFPCCDSPLSVSTKAEVANCKDIRSFDSACYHYRRFGMVKPWNKIEKIS